MTFFPLYDSFKKKLVMNGVKMTKNNVRSPTNRIQSKNYSDHGRFYKSFIEFAENENVRYLKK